MQDGWVIAWNAIKSQIQGSETGFNAWKAQTLNFFRTYQNTEEATRLAVLSLERELTPLELQSLEKTKDMKLTYENTRIDLRDRISATELALKQAENAKNTALKARDATLSQLGASRESGVLTLEQAKREFSKLTIMAPFDGSVTRVIASVGQRVNPGTPVLEVVSNSPEILVDLDAEIVSSLQAGDEVRVRVGEESFSGTISAIARSAGANLLYATRITVPGATKFIGQAATVIFSSIEEA
jgi:multidrug resistance efflux pump